MIKDYLLQLRAENLTPVQEVNGIFFKRDDLFAPFEAGSVNGGKLRQGAFLLNEAKYQGYKRVITGCSLISPQAPAIAALAKYFGLECLVLYGGTTLKSLEKKHMPRLVKYYGAEIEIASSGRSSVLYHRIREIQKNGDFIVLYGMNSKDPKYLIAFYESTANQVRNLPDELEHLAITCGSGITSVGIIYGLKKYKKHVKNIWLIGNAPNRESKIRERLSNLAVLTGINCWSVPFIYIDLFASGIKYENRLEDISWGAINMHPNYEAKAFFYWFQKNLIGKTEGKTCFWIVGSEPSLLKNV